MYLDGDGGLVVGVRGEGLGLLGRDGGVSLDEGGHHASGGLNAEGEGCDVEEQKVGNLFGGVAGQDGGLDRGSVGNGLIGVDSFIGLFSVEVVLD